MRKILLALWTALLVLAAPLGAHDARAAQLVMFEEEGCPWCAAFRREVLPIYGNTKEGRIAPLRRVDIMKARPDDLKHVKGIIYSPTFVLLDDEGREVGRIEGYPGFDTFWERLDVLLQKLKKRKKNTTEALNDTTGKALPAPKG